MRGAVLGQLWLSRCGRFIPACAGNGRGAAGHVPPGPVHPRVCGERRPLSLGDLSHYGSSPRVRGTDPTSPQRQPPRRFIPACAGNGAVAVAFVGATSVHPRVCGERLPIAADTHSVTGSSPRVRGTAAAQPRRLEPLRFIPACAGNGPAGRQSTACGSVHPRVCGERNIMRDPDTDSYGSSPRVRGTA